MKTGLVLGKFMPLHRGHMALIQFALLHCDKLIVMICASPKEPISGEVRQQWLLKEYGSNPRIHIVLTNYHEDYLPNTSVSSHNVSWLWAKFIKDSLPPIDIIFTSEPYGDYVAEFLNIEHKCFDQPRSLFNIAASSILKEPFLHWYYLPDSVKPFFTKKICISGSESTGKSTLTENLAKYFQTTYVPEMARWVIETTEEVKFDDLYKIANLHAQEIKIQLLKANKLLICDTDVNITKSYSKYLFNRTLQVEDWIEEANKFHLHIFLDTDCPYVQDGTRLNEKERNQLSHYHLKQLQESGISYHTIGGTWEQRFQQAITLIESQFLKPH